MQYNVCGLSECKDSSLCVLCGSPVDGIENFSAHRSGKRCTKLRAAKDPKLAECENVREFVKEHTGNGTGCDSCTILHIVD